MQIEYLFLLRSLINLGLGNWEPLSFQRGGLQVCIPKPISEASLYIKIQPGNGPVMFDISRGTPGSALHLWTTMVSVRLKSAHEIPGNEIDQTFQATALEVFHDFRSWIRVLTRQHWIGFQNSAFPQLDFNVNVITGNLKRPLRTAGTSTGFDYWKVLDQSTWNALGEKLANGRAPSAGQLFFCEGLVAMGNGDLAQAVVELGIACELEVYSTIVDVHRVRNATLESLKKIERIKFSRKVRLLGSLNGNSFRRFDAKAARLVNALYGMRGAAIHRADLPLVDTSKSRLWNTSQLIRFVHAVEKLLDWLNLQRSALA